MRALAPINNSKIPDPKESLVGVRKGAWSEEEDNLLRDCIGKVGEGKWHLIPRRAGLNRCRKSCRLRWLNYLKPDIKRGHFAADEMDLIMRMHRLLGNKWSLIAGRIPGRTANDVKNYWNTHVRKKDMSSSCKKQKQEKEQQQKITKTNIIKPRPRSFSKTTTTTHPHFLSGELAPISSYCNDAVPSLNDTPFRNEVTSETEAAVPQISDSEINSTWWETLLNDDVDVVDRDIINCNTINIMINYWKSTGLLGEDADTSITNPTGDNILVDQNVVTSWPPF